MNNLSLPHDWEARPYQKPLFQYMLKGGMRKKRANMIWHRRAGKDSVCLQIGAIATQERVGTYWHMLPTLQQARRVIWDGIDKLGRRMIYQAFPKELIASVNNSEMKIVFKNGSIWQCVGSDNYDSLVGTNPVGLIMSEYSIADPQAWEYLRPILLENDGWALFIYTPRGKTHGHKLFQMSEENPNWFSQKLTINDTGVMTDANVEAEIAAGMSREKAMQEFYCSFDIGQEGAYYTEELAVCESSGRRGNYPWDPRKLVSTWWDIGFRDHTSIIFTQEAPSGAPRIIDHMAQRNRGMPEWIRIVNGQEYDYDRHNGPHDIETHEWGSGATRTEMAHELGFDFEAVPKVSIDQGIEASRAMLRIAEFNQDTTENLWDNLSEYHREYNQKKQIFKDKPDHDHTSHDADAFRYLSVGWNARTTGKILTRDSTTGGYTPNIRIKRAYGSNRRSRA